MIKPPSSPCEVGLPSKFESWRYDQKDVLEDLLNTDKRAPVMCASTGFGKSPVYMTLALLRPGRTAIVTKTKGLQDQLMRDFGAAGLVDIRGKDNYPCSSRPGWSCKDGFAGGCTCRGSVECGWQRAYNIARTSKIVVTNYRYWIAEHKYGNGLGTFETVIFDEGHHAPDELAAAMQVRLSFHEVEELLQTKFPLAGEDGTIWKMWATATRGLAEKACRQKLIQMQCPDPKPTWMKEYHHLKNLVQKLATIGLMRASDWVWEEFEWGWQFDPIRYTKYAEPRLFLHIPNVVLTSATIRKKTTYMVGLGDDVTHFIEIGSRFDPERSPITWVPTMRVDRRAAGYEQLVLRIDQFLGRRLDRNGIIHVTSFPYRDTIVNGSRHRRIMESHWDGEPVSAAVRRFLDGRTPVALISPSITTGYDFVGDVCRYNVITKIPFQPITKVDKARGEIDRNYSIYKAAQTLEQECGRATRSEDDWCENVILDDHAAWFISRASGCDMLTKSFMRRYRKSNCLPEPMIMGMEQQEEVLV